MYICDGNKVFSLDMSGLIWIVKSSQWKARGIVVISDVFSCIQLYHKLYQLMNLKAAFY